jgi:succinate dehydrogenase/fumarate reductase flavoprotein subunit
MSNHVTVVGGGLAGLVAAIVAAEAGAPVHLFGGSCRRSSRRR